MIGTLISHTQNLIQARIDTASHAYTGHTDTAADTDSHTDTHTDT